MASMGGLSGAQLEVANQGAVMLEGAQAMQALMAQGSLDSSRVIQNEPGMQMTQGKGVEAQLAKQGSLGKETGKTNYADMLKGSGVDRGDMKATLDSAAKPAPGESQVDKLGKNNGKGGGRGI